MLQVLFIKQSLRRILVLPLLKMEMLVVIFQYQLKLRRMFQTVYNMQGNNYFLLSIKSGMYKRVFLF